MKKLLGLIVFPFLFLSTAFGQNFEFETIRTIDSPGFFMVRIFPLEGNKHVPIQNVFVKNYAERNARDYAEILPVIQELGGKIIEKEELHAHLSDNMNRIVFLGGDNDNFITFRINELERKLEEFEVFSETFLGNVYLKDIKLKFGGNISEVLPSQLPDIKDSPVFLVGKFKEDMKTRIEIRGIVAEGEIMAAEPLYLNDLNLADSVLAPDLPDIWEELWNIEHPPKVVTTIWDKVLKQDNLFPAILFFIAGIFFLLFFRSMRRSADSFEVFEQIQEDAKEENPLLKNIPFKVERKHSVTETKSPKKPVSLVAGNARTPRFSKKETKKDHGQNPASKAQR